MSAAIPPDVRADIDRLKNLCGYAELSELRLMACLDVWLSEWKAEMKAECEKTKEEMGEP